MTRRFFRSDDGKHSDTNKDRPAKRMDVDKDTAKELGDAVKRGREVKDNPPKDD